MHVAHRAGPEPPLPVALRVVEAILRLVGLRIVEIRELLRLEIEQRKLLLERQHQPALGPQRRAPSPAAAN